ncbi:HD domain-containing protein [Aminipila butyrica]|uniref:HD domain-containing protein n=1 Tax=Aminipila butyrica TaxID=433296 RepID=A0A858BWD1_9FIRM|nr:HD domain-containing protein [Aminipila butyrica]QIB69210.1 HD domain-containing protein [Aminipila butyrica]
MIINIPIDVEKIISRLEAEGFEAYIVGGCVRDQLLGIVPEDWDICTSAKPEQVVSCFSDCRLLNTGIQHGTVTILLGGQAYEVTTYRQDGTYMDGRRPEEVAFVTSLEEDLARRDFTVNTLAYNARRGLVDPYGGCKDLQAKLIRCVGEPGERLREDGLRIIRALRFASVLGFSIEAETARSLHNSGSLLSIVAVERIQTEFCKLLCGQGVKGVLEEYRDIIEVFLPELKPMAECQQHNPHHWYDVWKHTLEALGHTEESLVVRLAVLLHDVAKPRSYTFGKDGVGHFYGHGEQGATMAEAILKRLKMDGQTVREVCQLIKYHDAEVGESGPLIKKWLHKLGPVQFERLLQVKYADIMGQSDYLRERKLNMLGAIRRKLLQVLEEGQCFCLKDLAVNGHDLMALGIPAGKKVGELLEKLLEQVLEEQLENTRETLLQAVKRL